MEQDQTISAASKPLYDRLVAVVAKQLDVPAEQIVPQARFMEDLGADSIELLQLLTVLEDEFSMLIEDERFESIQTIEDAFALVQETAAQQA